MSYLNSHKTPPLSFVVGGGQYDARKACEVACAALVEGFESSTTAIRNALLDQKKFTLLGRICEVADASARSVSLSEPLELLARVKALPSLNATRVKASEVNDFREQVAAGTALIKMALEDGDAFDLVGAQPIVCEWVRRESTQLAYSVKAHFDESQHQPLTKLLVAFAFSDLVCNRVLEEGASGADIGEGDASMLVDFANQIGRSFRFHFCRSLGLLPSNDAEVESLRSAVAGLDLRLRRVVENEKHPSLFRECFNELPIFLAHLFSSVSALTSYPSVRSLNDLLESAGRELGLTVNESPYQEVPFPAGLFAVSYVLGNRKVVEVQFSGEQRRVTVSQPAPSRIFTGKHPNEVWAEMLTASLESPRIVFDSQGAAHAGHNTLFEPDSWIRSVVPRFHQNAYAFIRHAAAALSDQLGTHRELLLTGAKSGIWVVKERETVTLLTSHAYALTAAEQAKLAQLLPEDAVALARSLGLPNIKVTDTALLALRLKPDPVARPTEPLDPVRARDLSLYQVLCREGWPTYGEFCALLLRSWNVTARTGKGSHQVFSRIGGDGRERSQVFSSATRDGTEPANYGFITTTLERLGISLDEFRSWMLSQ